MTGSASETVVAFPHVLAVVVPFLGALVVAGLLVWAFAMGIRRMMRERPRPGADEHGRLPESGPVGEVSERREPDEVTARDERDRLTPHEIPGYGNASSRRSEDQRDRKWSPGTSGSFGSGGPGGR
ncbi:hypothetical protein GCM10018793_11790 [Streptomyces sulfonofaciens]|uniref:Secreted protein n=1 Tax=Streptomyces sulfonofaciens TaxID=68272 RepID=A0A919FVY8_9ACTN|nr:DUF6479 family protein [Streptomyces sulfonofaciens]GHH73295.1 hypothetical protein GCM10018793_11790 [Streptomyces sulfonofaciens]